MKVKKIYETDPWLEPWRDAIDARHQRILDTKRKLVGERSLAEGIANHLYYGLHRDEAGDWVFREWAPSATRIYIIGEFNNWKRTDAYALKPVGQGNWEIHLPAMMLYHGALYKLFIEWHGGGSERLPAYVTRTVQDPVTKVFCAQVWDMPAYDWKNPRPAAVKNPFIYECHIGMSSEEEKVSTFDEFRRNVLPRVKALGYDVLQIMALQEHPYYGSFGYQVSNFFALSSRFGTPDEFKHLVDDAHGMGISVIMDIVHSHSVDNEAEGLSRFDGRDDLYFYSGPQGHHPAWGSPCFDYGKDEVKYFLLSNCKFWLEEYHLDGFRFDGVTSMLYWDHGLGTDFGNYELYFGPGVDENAVCYLALANQLIREILPDAITIAEDVSGMAGLAAPFEAGGVGFGYRMAMGVADHWIKWIKEKSDEQWSMGEIWWELTNKRADERTVSYAECHDQALVGDKTIIFRLIDKEMYYSMRTDSQNLTVERGVALHKMIRLLTAVTAGNGYLNFMGNEFGHPEWIDFPREGNSWSFAYARRQWSLADAPELRYGRLQAFDAEMVHYLKAHEILSETPKAVRVDEEKQILIIWRRNSIFAFNFSPTGSFPDYGFAAPEGEYEMVLSSDDAKFDGFERLVCGERHITVGGELKLYLPSRCAIVLEKKK
ncbi:MAG: alpha amylase C-terminal domain-containing protein [Bacteroidales bacterium]|nr:alpha amylase C-terminal domain-containing protein [Bacteroidales bacterium]